MDGSTISHLPMGILSMLHLIPHLLVLFTVGYLTLYCKNFVSLIRKSQYKSPVLPKTSSSISLPPNTEITELWVYPIKSCRGIPLQSAHLLSTGLDLDRRWMFVDSKTRQFLTIRDISELTLIDTSIDSDKDELIISIRDKKTRIIIPAHPTSGWLKKNTQLVEAKIWRTETDAWEFPSKWTAPFASLLKREVSLLYKGPSARILGRNAAPSRLGRVASTCFADEFPLLMASAASMSALNQRLCDRGLESLSIERFRPNVVVKGTEAWAEDTWKTIEIGGTLTMDVVSRCGRCTVPNVNPNTAVRDKKEPFDTLMTFRRVDEGLKYKPCFGMMCVPREKGEIRAGMALKVLECTSEHKYLK